MGLNKKFRRRHFSEVSKEEIDILKGLYDTIRKSLSQDNTMRRLYSNNRFDTDRLFTMIDTTLDWWDPNYYYYVLYGTWYNGIVNKYTIRHGVTELREVQREELELSHDDMVVCNENRVCGISGGSMRYTDVVKDMRESFNYAIRTMDKIHKDYYSKQDELLSGLRPSKSYGVGEPFYISELFPENEGGG